MSKAITVSIKDKYMYAYNELKSKDINFSSLFCEALEQKYKDIHIADPASTMPPLQPDQAITDRNKKIELIMRLLHRKYPKPMTSDEDVRNILNAKTDPELEIEIEHLRESGYSE